MDDLYQDFIIDLFKNPKNKRTMLDADAEALASNRSCGDSIMMHLKIKRDIIADASFSGTGCAISVASASLLASRIRGKSLADVRAIGKEAVLRSLRIDLTKNPTRMRCALLSLDALKEALASFDKIETRPL